MFQRWQYRIVNLGVIDTAPRLQRVLGQLGAEGWELITVYDKASNWSRAEKGFALFKRPVPEGDEPTEWAILSDETVGAVNNDRKADGWY
jgi:hypothetical protein